MKNGTCGRMAGRKGQDLADLQEGTECWSKVELYRKGTQNILIHGVGCVLIEYPHT